MKKLALVMAFGGLALAGQASWYWPFGSDDSETEPPRLSVLMKPASDLIDEASDFAYEGKTSEAVEKYRAALSVLDRIEVENPDRAKKPEFATLRNKRAYVNAAIDSLLMAQVKDNAKSVAVSDTAQLEKRLADERAAKKKAEAEKKAKAEAAKKEKAEKAKKAKAKKGEVEDEKVEGEKVEVEKKAKAKAKDEDEEDEDEVDGEKKKVEVEKKAKAKKGEEDEDEDEDEVEKKKVEVEKKKVEVEKRKGEDEKKAKAKGEGEEAEGEDERKVIGTREQALADLAKGDYAAAELSVKAMLVEKPKNATALNIKAAIEVAQKRYKDAEKTLDQAIMSNPRSPYAYYNMARLLMRLDPAAKEPAKRYYDTGRSVGGAVDPELEKLLK